MVRPGAYGKAMGGVEGGNGKKMEGNGETEDDLEAHRPRPTSRGLVALEAHAPRPTSRGLWALEAHEPRPIGRGWWPWTWTILERLVYVKVGAKYTYTLSWALRIFDGSWSGK